MGQNTRHQKLVRIKYSAARHLHGFSLGTHEVGGSVVTCSSFAPACSDSFRDISYVDGADYLRALISASTFVTMSSVSPACLACGIARIDFKVIPFANPSIGFLEIPGTCRSKISTACVSFKISPTFVSNVWGLNWATASLPFSIWQDPGFGSL